MPKSCCFKSCSNSTKNNKNVKFQERIKDKGRRKLWMNAIGRVHTDKGGILITNVFGHPNHFMFMFAQSISSLVSLF